MDALKKKPDDPLALLGLGNSLFAEKRTEEAVAAFQKVLDVSPGVREAQEQLAAIKSHTTRKTTTLMLHPKSTPAHRAHIVVDTLLLAYKLGKLNEQTGG